MSGHSKWAQIKRKKAINDARRGKIFTKLIKEIQLAARLGGGDENSNPRLRQAIQQARAQNMPAANIERAIAKGTGELKGVNYEEISYEAYGPGSVAILMRVLTDNKKRTVSEVRHIVERHGGSLATTGSVSWIFETKGTITVNKDSCSEDEILLLATEAGAEDINIADDAYEIVTSPSDFENVKEYITNNKIQISDASISMIPKNVVKVDEKHAEKVLNLMEELEDHDDILNLYSNFDIDDEILKRLSRAGE